MNSLRKLTFHIVGMIALGGPSIAQANIIEFDLDYSLSLAPIFGNFGEGQILGGVGTFFPDDAFVFGLGDTLILNILFDQSLQVFDFGESTDEAFSFGLNIVSGSPLFSGTWTSSIEALGGIGDIWSDPITLNWIGGGAGFGWGGQGVEITGSQGIFSGIRWTTTLTSVNEGDPMTLSAFTGVQMHADGIRILPTLVPEPGTLELFGIGLFGLLLMRRKQITVRDI